MERCWCGARERRGEDGARSFVGGGGMSASERTGLNMLMLLLLLLWAVHVAGVSRGILWRTWELNDCFLRTADHFSRCQRLTFLFRNHALTLRKQLKPCVVSQPDLRHFFTGRKTSMTKSGRPPYTSQDPQIKPCLFFFFNRAVSYFKVKFV